MITDAILYGVWSGLLLTIMIGPVFFALLQTSVEKGFKAGLALAMGIALSDMLYILIATLSAALLAKYDSFQAWLGLFGGLIMMTFGLINALKGVKRPKRQQEGRRGLLKQVGQGFMLNGINPFVLLFWFSMATMATVRYHQSIELKFTFFASLLLTVFTTDLIKANLAVRLRKLLTLRRMLWLNRLVGLALILFSLTLFHFAWKYWWLL